MRTIRSISVLLMAVIFTSSACIAQETPQDNYYKKMELSDKVVNSGTKLEYNEQFNHITREEEKNPKEKSAFLGAVMSAVIPGAGEFYAQSYIKSAIFFAVEVGLWSFYAINRSNGDNKTDEYEGIANSNWSLKKYATWLKDNNFNGASNINIPAGEPANGSAEWENLRLQVNEVERINFSHSLPKFGDQQYYEVIGKYQSFIAGWSYSDINAVNSGNYLSYRPSQVDAYMGVRQDANDFYDMASLSTNIVIANHLLSAADAAWSVSMFNKELKVSTSFELKSIYSSKDGRRITVPFGNVTVDF
jgi:hypothetical protein